jgi:PAS domain S-box-containing protein
MSYKFSTYFKPIVISTGVISITVGSLVILGWILNIQVLKSLNPEYISMKANTALCFIMSGIAVVLLYESNRTEWLKILARFLLGIVLLISSINLLEYILGWNAGIDEFLFREGQGTAATMYPGRMALNTIVCFFLLCIALLITDNKNKWTANLSQLLALSASILCVLPQLGYAYNESELFTFAYKTPMALNTAITFLTLSFGIFFIRPNAGLLNLLNSEGIGGIFARRIFPVLIILPIIFIWIRLAVQVGGYQFKTIDLSIISIIYISLFIVAYWRTFKELNNLDIERQISERQLLLARDEAEQHKSELEAIFNSVNEGIAVADMTGNFFLVNPAQAKISGFANGDEMKRSLAYFAEVYEFFYPGGEQVPVDQWPISKILRGESVSENVHRVRRLDTGEDGIFSFSGEPVLDENRKQILAVMVTRDITKLKHISDNEKLAHEILGLLNKIEDSELMIKKVIEKIKERSGIEAVAIRLKNGDDFPYYGTIGFSPEFVDMERYLCNYDEKGNLLRDLKGDPLLECMCGNILCGRIDPAKSFFTEGGSFCSNNTSQLLGTTTPAERLARTRNKCNSAGFESVALIPIRSGEKIIGLLQLNDHRINAFTEELIPFFEGVSANIGIALMRNRAVTELGNLNVELERRVTERTQQLNDSNSELESFAYSISHDLRTPLRHIIAFSGILESELNVAPDSEVNIIVMTIKNSAARLSKLIDELLSYSLLGRTDLRSEMVSLGGIVNEVLAESRDVTSDRNVELKIGPLPDVEADKTLLYLVFQNLIGNALKFTQKKEKAIIEIYSDETGSDEYKIFIKDNGAGFNMDYADKLFGVFKRLHSSEEFEGTGIGLATVRRILKRHGGTISAEAKVNEGAVFCFTLPKKI